jgi:hypothetical protein
MAAKASLSSSVRILVREIDRRLENFEKNIIKHLRAFGGLKPQALTVELTAARRHGAPIQ